MFRAFAFKVLSKFLHALSCVLGRVLVSVRVLSLV